MDRSKTNRGSIFLINRRRVDAARIRGKVGLADDLAVWSGGCLGLGGQQKSCEECAESGGNKIHGASELSEREVYKARCGVLDLREASARIPLFYTAPRSHLSPP